MSASLFGFSLSSFLRRAEIQKGEREREISAKIVMFDVSSRGAIISLAGGISC